METNNIIVGIIQNSFLTGIIIPFVDLTHCNKLEYVNINYLNQYARKYNEFGPGYPRPIIFVRPSFDEAIIPQDTRRQKNIL